MPKVKQLTVACENRPGTLAHIAKVLGGAKEYPELPRYHFGN